MGLSFFGEVISLDLAKADINIDIMEWDYKQYPPGYFHVVWASPCCTCFSNLKRCNIGRFGITAESIEADISNIGLPMLRRTEEIIKYFKPKFYFIENPQTARTKDYVALNPGDFFDVDYCMYGKPFRKRTRIWTNLKSFEPLLCDKNCGSFDGKKTYSTSKLKRRWVKSNHHRQSHIPKRGSRPFDSLIVLWGDSSRNLKLKYEFN